MDDTFKIYVHRLKDGHLEHLAESLSPEFLDIHEAELAFHVPVLVEGTATVTDEMLVLQLHVETEATMPCSICNTTVQVKILMTNFCHIEPLAQIKGAIFDYSKALREGILLELPYITECNDGDCPERNAVIKFFAKGENHGSTT